MEELHEIYSRLRIEERREIIQSLRSLLGIKDAEVADDLKELGEKIIATVEGMEYIDAFGINVGYVRSYQRKTEKGKIILGDCRKVNKAYGAFLPFDFIITIYDPNVRHLSENQLKVLMLHELKHIGVGPKGFRIEEHDIEDFKDICRRFGLDWNGLNEEVPDIFSM